MKRIFSVFFLSILFPPFVLGMDEHADYMSALRKEINNRALAGRVVSVLADSYKGSDQGVFWRAYDVLEEYQRPIYLSKIRCYNISESVFLNWVKAKGSILFSRFFNDKFISMMSSSTGRYLEDLKAVEVASAEKDQIFWMYVIAQERVQVIAFEYAAKKDYQRAAEILNDFSKDIEPLYDALIGC